MASEAQNTQYAIHNTLHEIQSTKEYVRIYKQIMQNKANVKDAQINVNSMKTTRYKKVDIWLLGKTNPIQSQLKPKQSQSCPPQARIQTQFVERAKNDAKSAYTKD